MSNTRNLIQIISVAAQGVVAEYRGVTSAHLQASTKGAPIIGFATDSVDAAGKMVGVATVGEAAAETGGAFSAGALLQMDASGRVIALTTGAPCGMAREASTGAGEIVRVLVLPGTGKPPMNLMEEISASGVITQYRAVGFDNAQVNGAGEVVKGVAQVTAADTDSIALVTRGPSQAIAGAAVAIGAQLEVTAAGKFITLNTGIWVATAREAAAGDDTQFEIDIR